MNKFTKIFALIAIALTTIPFTASAEIPAILYGGVSVGANATSIRDTETNFGYQAGGLIGVNLPIFDVTVEAIYSHSGCDFSKATDAKIATNSIDIPVLVSVPVLGPICAKAGPSFNVYNSARVKYGFDRVSEGIGSIKPTVGYVLGLGVNVLRFSFDVRYNGQFDDRSVKVFNFGEQALNNYNFITNTFSASVGYRF